MNIISIKNLNFKYKNKIIFEKLNLNIKKNSITTIIGKNGSGKSTLVKLLTGIIPSDNIKYNDEILNKKTVFKKIGVVSDVLENEFIGKTVKEYLNITLLNMEYNKKKIKKRLEYIIDKLGLYEVINENPNNLSNSKKQLVSLAGALIYEPEILILDNALAYFDSKDEILKLLLELKENMTIIHITQDIEDTLISDQVVIIDKKVILKGNKEKIYKEEKTLNNLGYKLPFMVELSNRLQFYNLIDETMYDMQKMVDTLWK